jgi:hypothetical protein
MFDVLAGRPSGSGNARTITSMLSGMRQAPAMPRTGGPSSAVIPISESALAAGTNAGGGGQGLPFTVGKIIGTVFRKLSGGAGASAIGAAGQTGMSGGLKLAGSALGSMVTAPIAIGAAIFSVSKALGEFGAKINEQSRYLRSYDQGTNVSFGKLDREKEKLEKQHAGATSENLEQSTDAEIKFRKSWQPIKDFVKNMWLRMGTGALRVGTVLADAGTGLLGPGPAKGFEKAAKSATARKEEEDLESDDPAVRNKARAAKELKRLKGLSTFGSIMDRMLNPKGLLHEDAKQLGAPAAQNAPGQLAMQMGLAGKMMGLNAPPPPAAAAAPAAFEAGNLAKAVGVGLMKPRIPKVKLTKAEKVEARAAAKGRRFKKILGMPYGLNLVRRENELRKRREGEREQREKTLGKPKPGSDEWHKQEAEERERPAKDAAKHKAAMDANQRKIDAQDAEHRLVMDANQREVERHAEERRNRPNTQFVGE